MRSANRGQVRDFAGLEARHAQLHGIQLSGIHSRRSWSSTGLQKGLLKSGATASRSTVANRTNGTRLMLNCCPAPPAIQLDAASLTWPMWEGTGDNACSLGP